MNSNVQNALMNRNLLFFFHLINSLAESRSKCSFKAFNHSSPEVIQINKKIKELRNLQLEMFVKRKAIEDLVSKTEKVKMSRNECIKIQKSFIIHKVSK